MPTTYRIRITKGCRAIGVHKGAVARVTPYAVPTAGVKVSPILWLAGNRVNLPTWKVGDSMSLNTGDPTRRVVAVVEEVYGEVYAD